MATIDPVFAKSQMTLLAAPRSQHPYGTIPAYEWDFNAVNPPVIAWAVWQDLSPRVAAASAPDVGFLKSMFDPLLMMLTWWLNRKDREARASSAAASSGSTILAYSTAISRCRPVARSSREMPPGGWRCSS